MRRTRTSSELCSEHLGSCEEYLKHVLRQHPAPDGQCALCEKAPRMSLRGGHLREHMTQKHCGGTLFECKCGAAFTSRSTCTRHKNGKCGMKNGWKCTWDGCSMKQPLPNWSAAAAHIDSHVREAAQPASSAKQDFVCGMSGCGQRMHASSGVQVAAHMVKHVKTYFTYPTPYRCKLCDMFLSNPHWRAHMAMHVKLHHAHFGKAEQQPSEAPRAAEGGADAAEAEPPFSEKTSSSSNRGAPAGTQPPVP
eukprot:TRINITY_DN474_c0_g2_i1.p1 TRINITY_DN474_c0_g2~~TRINITY_DN474_c0_g2_i1.p1  ORF type:complete len:250 (+),score=35.65 TRINITY_DN474_c0_g2_i1:575-1324(+)